MNEQKVKEMLWREVLNEIDDGEKKRVLKTIIFDKETHINWETAYNIMVTFMSELMIYPEYAKENMK